MANAEKSALERPLIRYFCTVTARDSDQDSWGDVGWDYFVALQKHFRVRVFPNGLLHQVHISKIESRWGACAEVFSTFMTSPCVNVVCGSKEDLERYWTINPDVLFNVGITTLESGFDSGRMHTQVQRQWYAHMEHAKAKYGAVDEGDHGIYRKYDLIVCLSADDAIALKASGVVAKHLQPGECAAAILNMTDSETEPSSADS